MDTIFAATYGEDIRQYYHRRSSTNPGHAQRPNEVSDSPASSAFSSPALSDSEWASQPTALLANNTSEPAASTNTNGHGHGLGLAFATVSPASQHDHNAGSLTTGQEEPGREREQESSSLSLSLEEPSLGAAAFSAYIDTACERLNGFVKKLMESDEAREARVRQETLEAARRQSMCAWRDQHGAVEGWLD